MGSQAELLSDGVLNIPSFSGVVSQHAGLLVVIVRTAIGAQVYGSSDGCMLLLRKNGNFNLFYTGCITIYAQMQDDQYSSVKPEPVA